MPIPPTNKRLRSACSVPGAALSHEQNRGEQALYLDVLAGSLHLCQPRNELLSRSQGCTHRGELSLQWFLGGPLTGAWESGSLLFGPSGGRKRKGSADSEMVAGKQPRVAQWTSEYLRNAGHSRKIPFTTPHPTHTHTTKVPSGPTVGTDYQRECQHRKRSLNSSAPNRNIIKIAE